MKIESSAAKVIFRLTAARFRDIAAGGATGESIKDSVTQHLHKLSHDEHPEGFNAQCYYAKSSTPQGAFLINFQYDLKDKFLSKKLNLNIFSVRFANVISNTQ